MMPSGVSQRVLATQRAEDAARQVRDVLGGVTDQLRLLKQVGQRLSNPIVWDGPSADQYRSTHWPQLSTTVDSSLSRLERLGSASSAVIAAVIEAGSRGTMSVTGPVAPEPALSGPPGPGELAQRRAWWARLSEAERQQYLRTDPADVAYLATPAELRAAGYASLQDVYRRQSYTDAGIDGARWIPGLGLKANDRNVKAVYAFYQRLWDGDHNLQWAGMGKLAGATVYGGLEDLYVLSQLPRDRLVQIAESGNPLAAFLVTFGSNEAQWFETKFLTMQKNIFDDLGWQHDAYEHGGIDAIRALAASGTIDPLTLKAWERIDSGVPSQVAAGNEALLRREQFNVIQGMYDAMRNHNPPEGRIFTDMLSENARSPIPGGEPFRDSGGFHVEIHLGGLNIGYDSSDVTRFPDRWHWITSDMLPKYLALLHDPSQAQKLIDTPLTDRAAGYRMLPGLNVDGY
jgi:hypothetical protein